MTLTDDSTDRLVALEAKIDTLSEQMAYLAQEAELQARQRESFAELRDDVMPIAGDALAIATRELDDLSRDADLTDTIRLLRTVVEVAPTLDRTLVALAQVSELVEDAAPLGTDALGVVVDRLAEAERKGYFAFARAGAGIVDRVVTNFDEADLEQLGDNTVAILEAVREITQPEMLSFLGRMVEAVRVEQRAVESETAEPPSLWSLARQIRDPEVRRGMARALHTLRSVSAETTPHSVTHRANTSPERDST